MAFGALRRYRLTLPTAHLVTVLVTGSLVWRVMGGEAAASGDALLNAPLALAAAEVRYRAVAEGALALAVRREIRDLLDEGWLVDHDTHHSPEPGGAALGRITSRDSARILTPRAESFTLEVANYRGFDDFRLLLGAAASAVGRVLRPDGISRVGLRYINEVAVPESAPRWSRWLAESLMPPGLPPSIAPGDWTGAVHYQVTPEHSLVLRYGTSVGPVVSDAGPLKRQTAPPGPVFVLDFDSSWQPDAIPGFAAESITAAAVRLRQPVRELFDSLIEAPLMDVFRQEPDHG